MYLSVCLNSVFRGVPLSEAVERAYFAGFGFCEFWGWWDQDIDSIASAKEKTGMQISAMCTKMVPLTDKNLRSEYINGLKESIEIAKRLGINSLISQVGADQKGLSREVQHASIVEGLKQCLPLLEESGITLLIEPLNDLYDHKGYYLAKSAEAYEITNEVDSKYVKILFDVYHQQLSEGNILNNLEKCIDRIGHIHIAGVPGRHEINENGELNYPAVIKKLKALGYKGAVGLEYFPEGDPEKSLFDVKKILSL
ncbi:MAG: glyoxylate-induced protein [Clostridiales bacterium]|nr:glyoxylate-induced protein [Clostridiales bacterium]